MTTCPIPTSSLLPAKVGFSLTSMPATPFPTRTYWYLAGVFLLALALRVMYISLTPAASSFADDTVWYIDNGRRLLANVITAETVVPFPPLYSLFTASVSIVWGDEHGITVIRVVQALLGACTSLLIWRIAYGFTGNRLAAFVASFGIALNPILIIENNVLVSETIFIFLLYWALSFLVNPRKLSVGHVLASGALFGLACLTRAAIVAFPFGLALYLLALSRSRAMLLKTALMVIVYVSIVGTWSLYNLVYFNRIVFGGYGASDLLLASTVGYTGSANIDASFAANNDGQVPQSNAERSAVATRVTLAAVAKDPLGYLVQQSQALLSALIQPHNTVRFAGESLKDSVSRWFAEERSIEGLRRILQDSTFLPKATLYLFHWAALLGGTIGVIVAFRRIHLYGSQLGILAYFLAVHFVLLAIPRYLLPITPALWIFTSIALSRRLAMKQ